MSEMQTNDCFSNSWLTRTVPLLGEENLSKLANSKVCIIGLGGVGGPCAEAILRAGVGSLILVDADVVDISNLNRQIISNTQNIGEKKTLVCKDHLLNINPNANIKCLDIFLNKENLDEILNEKPDYIIDAIDTISTKIALVEKCKTDNVPIITCFGTGNKLDPSKLTIGKITETASSGCPVARVMRRELKRREVFDVDVVFSTEIPQKTIVSSENGRHSPASISFVPPVAGYFLASFVIRKLSGII